MISNSNKFKRNCYDLGCLGFFTSFYCLSTKVLIFTSSCFPSQGSFSSLSLLSFTVLKYQFHFWSGCDVSLFHLLVTFLNRYFFELCHTLGECLLEIFKLTLLHFINVFSSMTWPKLNNYFIAGALRVQYCLSCCQVLVSLSVHIIYFYGI